MVGGALIIVCARGRIFLQLSRLDGRSGIRKRVCAAFERVLSNLVATRADEVGSEDAVTDMCCPLPVVEEC